MLNKLIMEKQIINLTPEYFLNHKNDLLFNEYHCLSSLLLVYVTKMYKLVRIENDNETFILNLSDFIEILLSIYLKSFYLKKMIKKKKIVIFTKIRTVEVYYNKVCLIEINYSKIKVILNDLNHLYMSHVINHQKFIHIDNKKKEITYIFDHFKNIQKRNNNDTFIHLILKNKNEIEHSTIILNKNLLIKLINLYFLKSI